MFGRSKRRIKELTEESRVSYMHLRAQNQDLSEMQKAALSSLMLVISGVNGRINYNLANYSTKIMDLLSVDIYSPSMNYFNSMESQYAYTEIGQCSYEQKNLIKLILLNMLRVNNSTTSNEQKLMAHILGQCKIEV